MGYKVLRIKKIGTEGEEDTVRGSQTIGTLKVLEELSGLDGVRGED